MWDEPLVGEKDVQNKLNRYHKRRWFIRTAGRWPWKSETAKKCVTTYLPNESALKMDDAKVCYLSRAFVATQVWRQRVGRCSHDVGAWICVCVKSWRVQILVVVAIIQTSYETHFVGWLSFEDCSGEGFLVNGVQTRVSRSWATS